MLMPKTAMNKDCFMQTRKYEVWLARQITPVEAEPVTHSVCGATDADLGFHTLAANSAHVCATLFF
jgi:hypothetical protein